MPRRPRNTASLPCRRSSLTVRYSTAAGEDRLIRRLSPKVTGGLLRMRQETYRDAAFARKYKLLAAMAISIALRCEPCIRAYVTMARGVTQQEADRVPRGRDDNAGRSGGVTRRCAGQLDDVGAGMKDSKRGAFTRRERALGRRNQH
jgi:hypothetical protein